MQAIPENFDSTGAVLAMYWFSSGSQNRPMQYSSYVQTVQAQLRQVIGPVPRNGYAGILAHAVPA